MRFTMKKDSIARLGLPARVAEMEFDGPPVSEGILSGFPRGILKWAKRELKVDRVEQLDVIERQLAYYLLTMRNVDHTLLPFSRLDDVAAYDFTVTPHEVTQVDRDGDCLECSMPTDASVHRLEDGHVSVVEPDPTPAPDSPGKPSTTETATPSQPPIGSSS